MKLFIVLCLAAASSAWPVMPTNLFPYGFEYVGQYSPENVNYLSHIQYNGRHSQTQESSSQENLQTGSNEQSGEENEQTISKEEIKNIVDAVQEKLTKIADSAVKEGKDKVETNVKITLAMLASKLSEKGCSDQEIRNYLKETVNAMTSGTYPPAQIQQERKSLNTYTSLDDLLLW